jgi:signal transduction histidine kinase
LDITELNFSKQMQSEFPLQPSEDLFNEYQRVKSRKDLLEKVFNSLTIGMSVFEPVYDDNNRILDFRLIITNKEVERQTGRTDLQGIYYAKEYPGIRQVGIFDLMIEVMESGEARQLEYFYPGEGFERWFSCMFIKLDSGLVATNVEVEKLKNYTVLRQVENLAQVGSWEYDLLTGKFSWTPGMYTLFNLPQDTPVKPEFYIQYATEKSVAAAKKLVHCITSGEGDFEKVLDIRVGGQTRTLKVLGTVIRDINNEPIAVCGTDVDITQEVKLRQEKQRLQAQYKEILGRHNENILRTTIKTQEEERRRISESLHNGLGQLLYGVKLSLDQMNRKSDDPDMVKMLRKNTEDLLTQAIKETRRISHELSPSILENFGLQVAVNDICEQFNQGLNIRCDFQESNVKISKELELFIYRTIQELSTNIVKHAKATEASLEVFFSKDQVNINLQDNGVGLRPGKQDGIGLKTIQTQLSLLKGTFSISSPGGVGTLIKITIPNSANRKNGKA